LYEKNKCVSDVSCTVIKIHYLLEYSCSELPHIKTLNFTLRKMNYTSYI